LLALAGSPLAAQQRDTLRVDLGDRAPRPAGPGTIVGIVVDTTSAPLDSIDVYIASLKKRTRTDGAGRFRFDDVKSGTYDVTARRPGFYPQVVPVRVGADTGGTVRFVLVPAAPTLAPVVTVSARGGLSGVIGDTAYRALPGARINVLASSHHTVADSTGAFFLPVHPGKYWIRIMLEGFASQLMSVTVPPDSGRRVMVWLAPPSRPPSPIEEVNVSELEQRMLRRKATSTVYTREDLLRTSMTELTQLVRQAAVMPVDEGCPALIDGGPRIRFLWEITKDEIESVEIYPPGGLPNSARPLRGNQYRGNIRGGASPLLPSGMDLCSVVVIVWLRK